MSYSNTVITLFVDVRLKLPLTAIPVATPVVIERNATDIVFSAEDGAFYCSRVGRTSVIIIIVAVMFREGCCRLYIMTT